MILLFRYASLLFLFLVAGMNLPVRAAPVVLHDAGTDSTRSMEAYMRILRTPARFSLPDDPRSRAALMEEIQARARAHGGNGGVRVPVRTPGMQVGRIESQDAYFPNLITPIFVVGADARSLAWLATWREALVRIGAIGWVVQAEDTDDLRAIAEAGRGLRMLTMAGDAIPGAFGVSAYPVLISSRAIEQ